MTTTDETLALKGVSLIGGSDGAPGGPGFSGVDAAGGQDLEPTFHSASPDDVERACSLAEAAFDAYRSTSPDARAAFLEAVAQAILDIGDSLIVRAMAETGLPRPRLEGERGRTVGQLRLFASVLRDGGHLDVRIDPALPDRTPAPRPDLRLRNIPLGPVAVFGASNFPLAFSVAGGDTASALAAGCPVVVKAHPAHPGVSELVGRAIQSVVRSQALPEGVFSLLFDAGHGVGAALAAHRHIKAVGFTGSRAGGMALVKIAAARPEPIPVYAEMSSINPVVLLPAALAARGEAIGKAFVGSLTLGAGQFCTNPGLILAIEGDGLDRFLVGAASALQGAAAQTMLTPVIHKAFCSGAARLAAHAEVVQVASGLAGAERQGQAALFATSGRAFLANHALQEEVFGAASLVVRCRDLTELQAVVESLEGQLTAAIHTDAADHDAAAALLPLLERKVGRILFNGFGTGVEVAHAMVHGGPFPATSDSRTTSVGSLAINRFLRPVSYQDVPTDLLPVELRDENAWSVPRRLSEASGLGQGGRKPAAPATAPANGSQA